LRRCRQHQRIAKLDDLPDVVAVHDFERRQAAGPLFDIKLAWLGDQMIQVFERDLDDVVIGIVGDTEQRQPVRFNLIAQLQRDDLDFRLFAFERSREAIEERTPLFLVEFAGRHDKISVPTAL